ncbi:MAG: tRNA (guanosine(37)-N1)-methyltransferase TrmD [Gammaproteobacteria bacterium]|nr:tRNA (guanosine(37)-N1)-methyltransferase TrmD [Gammaproteobacteria bacterium]MBT8051479.1 tRNA (guanosine(37)-N1)-methyltransferase TrmD [Gammaproteobacteria bacterium]MBT8055647.1 tRNA (guanosine(37)-N1)-methyltransferase TrmD [Gammaproteobacteria bacterium]NNJ79570.1 tRNA (guanosine(37)-N1)-methyltransferase TrmD [Xanthomonadales bacterium]
MRIQVITLFPDEFRPMVDLGVTGRAIRDGDVGLELLNPRDFAIDRHRTVDDRPYGGGPGMVMAVEPLRSTIRAARENAGANARVGLMSPQGRLVDQAAVRELSQREELILVCGRYEGFDERLIALEIDEEWSIGDYVLSGGELAAAVMIDAVTRLLPGVLGDEQSAEQDSFSDGLLDCQHYTRPERIEGLDVPSVLLSGDHGAIERWRKKQSLGRTWLRRPDLLDGKELDKESAELLAEFRAEYEHTGSE